MTGSLALLMAAAYLVGTIPFGLIVAKAKGVDIRAEGSGNYGATNVGRVLGRSWGILVLLLDMGKGAATVLAAKWAFERLDPAANQTAVDGVLLGAGVACILGNTAPFYLGFRGGKGVATSLGIMLGIWPYLTLAGASAFILFKIVKSATGYVSLASITAALSLPPLCAASIWWRGEDIGRHWPLLALTFAVAIVVVIRHRSNISRLRSGTENRIGGDPDGESAAS